jgi:hypothetical protein
MELLLNLAWLLLAMPAYWLWRDARNTSARRRFTALQCLLALGCLLVILFPVVSATDDLRAMRAELEESPGKGSVCRSGSEKSCSAKWRTSPAMAAASCLHFAREENWHRAPALPLSVTTVRIILHDDRAPPRFIFA